MVVGIYMLCDKYVQYVYRYVVGNTLDVTFFAGNYMVLEDDVVKAESSTTSRNEDQTICRNDECILFRPLLNQRKRNGIESKM